MYNIHMEEAIKTIATQFNFSPVIENGEKLKPAESFVLCGMGGSHLSAGLLKIYNPKIDVYVHRDYGLPLFAEKRLSGAMYIASSYSGNTEEVLHFAETAREKGLNVVAVAIGGQLIDWAKKHSLPYIQLPDTGIQPRSAVGFSMIAIAKIIEGDEAVAELQKLGTKLSPLKTEEQSRTLADSLKGKIPVVYSSRRNLPIAYNWKIKFNETAKIPAFYNVFPELNHNEMTGFDVVDSTRALSEKFHFIFLTDTDARPQINHRMEVCKTMYEDRGLSVTSIPLSGETVFEKIFNSLTLADWTSLHLSRFYKVDAQNVPMVEEFKKKIAG